jgi:hypothetical protein
MWRESRIDMKGREKKRWDLMTIVGSNWTEGAMKEKIDGDNIPTNAKPVQLEC